MGFSEMPKNLRSIAFHNAIRNLQIVSAHAHGQARFVLAVEIDHRSEINMRQNITVDHQQRFIALFQQTKRASRAQWLFLVYITEIHAEVFAISKMLRYRLRLEVRRKADAADSRFLQLADDALEDRAISDMQHGLRSVIRQRPQPLPNPPAITTAVMGNS